MQRAEPRLANLNNYELVVVVVVARVRWIAIHSGVPISISPRCEINFIHSSYGAAQDSFYGTITIDYRGRTDG
jgi:hypothetical protein